MKTNEGGIDRVLRVIMGLALLILGIWVFKTTGWTIAIIIVGAVLFITGLTGFCALYIPLGINTRSVKKGTEESTPS